MITYTYLKNCPICDSSDCNLVINTKDDKLYNLNLLKESNSLFNKYVDVPLKVYQCQKCSFSYLNPRLSDESLNRLYHDLYQTDYYESRISNKEHQYSGYYKIIAKYLKKDAPALLDFGCSTGIFLGIAQKNGCKVMGIELSNKAAESAKSKFGGNRIINGSLNEFKNINEKFDVITFNNVLEHLDNPKTYLKIAADKLSQDGLIFIVVPNFNSLKRVIMKDKWSLLLHEHINYFSNSSMKYLIKQHGLQLIESGSINHEVLDTSIFSKVKNKQTPKKSAPGGQKDSLWKLAFLALITDLSGILFNQGNFSYYLIKKVP